MPKVEGTIPRKILPVFVVKQQFGDVRDEVYNSILNGLLKKYESFNENNADAVICIYLLNITTDGIYTSNSLTHVADSLSEYVMEKKNETEGTFANAINILSCVMSTNELLSSEVGYYEPIIYFLVDDLDINNVEVRKIKSGNEWFQKSTKLVLPFADYSDKFYELVGTREAIFVVSEGFDENMVSEFVNTIYDIRINSLTHSIRTYFAQSGDICAAMFRGDIPDGSSILGDDYDIVKVDPLDEKVETLTDYDLWDKNWR